MFRVIEELTNCQICPRQCGVNRYQARGHCQAGAYVRVAKACLHHWEEPCISGERGSGTVFFSHCSLRCAFCQNYVISSQGKGQDITLERLVHIFLELQAQGAHNINLVTPTHYMPHLRWAIPRARELGLTIPVVYNSSGYERVESLRALRGLVDVYLPDLKFFAASVSRKWCAAGDYFSYASQAVLEMFHQVGAPRFDRDGMLQRGLMIRHLLLPGGLEDSKCVVDWVVDNLPSAVYLNIMAQYTPLGQANQYPEICRRVTTEEYEELVDYALMRGLGNGYLQDVDSAGAEYVPDFDLAGVYPEESEM